MGILTRLAMSTNNCRRSLEGHEQQWEAAVLRGAIKTFQTSHGKAPGLPIPTETETNMYRGWQEDAYFRVQGFDETTTSRNATDLVSRGWSQSTHRWTAWSGRYCRLWTISSRIWYPAWLEVTFFDKHIKMGSTNFNLWNLTSRYF